MTDLTTVSDRPRFDYTDSAVEPELAEIDDADPAYRPPPIQHLVLVLHGILSNSDRWMQWDEYVETGGFADVRIIVRPISYDMIGPVKLFTGAGRRNRADLVARRIRAAIDETPHDMVSIHCHSNGTKVYSDLPDDLQRDFEWVFFAGSICRLDDDQRIARPRNRIINDCGVNDVFPLIATALMPWRFGHTGVVGFHNPPFHDRFFPYGHSRATGVDHFGQHLVPILRTGDIGRGVLPICPRTRLYGPWLMRGGGGGVLGGLWWLAA